MLPPRCAPNGNCANLVDNFSSKDKNGFSLILLLTPTCIMKYQSWAVGTERSRITDLFKNQIRIGVYFHNFRTKKF